MDVLLPPILVLLAGWLLIRIVIELARRPTGPVAARSRWSVRRWLGFVALVGLSLAAMRANLAVGSALLGTVGPAWLRTLAAVDRAQAAGSPLGRGAVAAELADESIRAGLILAVVVVPAAGLILIFTARP